MRKTKNEEFSQEVPRFRLLLFVKARVVYRLQDYDADYLFSTMQMMSKEDVIENIVKNEGYDYQKYSKESQGIISSCVSIAVSVKSVLDTPLLTDDGLLTDESEETVVNIETFLKNMEINY